MTSHCNFVHIHTQNTHKEGGFRDASWKGGEKVGGGEGARRGSEGGGGG
jgi:hypothetical protein